MKTILAHASVFSPLRRPGSYLVDPCDKVGTFENIKPAKVTKKVAKDFVLLGAEPELTSSAGVSLHTDVDTEFTFLYGFKEHPLKHSPRVHLLTQMKHVHETVDQAVLIAQKPHANTINAARVKHELTPFPVATSDADVVDFLRLRGYQVDLRREPDVDLKHLPMFEHCMYAHMMLAELFLVYRGDFAKDLLGFVRSSSNKVGQSISMNRRLTFASTSRNGFQTDRILLPWVITIDGQEFRYALAGFDSCAVHGVASYADLLQATGLSTDDKFLLTTEDKRDMLQTFINKPLEAEMYARGDLMVYKALENNADNFGLIAEALGIDESLQKPPKMTIGSTVLHMFTGVFRTEAGLLDTNEWNKWEELLMMPASAAYLRSRGMRTTTLMSKVQGGRCRNNRPNVVSLVDVLADLDIDGAYGEGQRNQLFPFGKPESLYDYELNSPHKHYYTLRETLKLLGATKRSLHSSWDFSKCELVPGLFFMLVSSVKPLDHMQDFFCSWYADSGNSQGSLHHKLQQKLVKYLEQQATDTEREASDQPMFNEEDGELKIHLREIINGVLTWDGLQWILHVCSAAQREELLDNLQVNECLFYSKHKQVATPQEVIESYNAWSNKTKATRVKQGKSLIKRTDDGECHTWCAINLGKLIIDRLLCNRKLYPKKTPLNTMYKLCVNTLYGDMVSKYFTSSNVIVGNNITARCRALAWYMEHGLYGFQTVTDGCAFVLNTVVYPYQQKRVTAENLTMLWTESNPVRNRHVQLAPLAGYARIELTWVEYKTCEADKVQQKFAPQLHLISKDGSVRLLSPVFKTDAEHEGCQKLAFNPALAWVNKQSFRHLRRLFPEVDVLGARSTKVKPAGATDPTPVYYRRLGQFAFETKDLYNGITLKGTSDYSLSNPNDTNVKMRSHELKKPHIAVDGSTDYAEVSPGKLLMQLITSDPTRVARLKPAVKEGILKPSDYANRREHYEQLGLVPGDQIRKPMMIREFSLTQFTFATRNQYLSWKKAIDLRKERYGQSLEAYFCNTDGTLDYKRMVETVATMVSRGVDNPFAELDKSNNQRNLSHPYFSLYQSAKEQLNPGKLEFVEETEED